MQGILGLHLLSRLVLENLKVEGYTAFTLVRQLNTLRIGTALALRSASALLLVRDSQISDDT